MIRVRFTFSFIKHLKHLEKDLFSEVLEKIELFKNPKNHPLLKVHKLHGRLSDFYSCSVNYKTRIVFEYGTKNKKEAWLHFVGDHDVYK